MNLFTIGKYTFAPQIKWALLTLIVAYFLSSLGFWQLQRADEKRTLLTQHHHLEHATPIKLSAESLLGIKQNQPIQIKGIYDSEHIFFLDNQFYQHQLGYEIIEPLFEPDSQRVILVSRGWIKAPEDRKNLPKIKTPTGIQEIHGRAYFPSKALLLGNNWDKNNTEKQWPKRIEKIQFRAIIKWLKNPIYPFILRLDPDEPHGFIRDWPIVSVTPERHIGYAIQWFAMAFTVFIIFIVLSVKKRK